MRKGHLSLAIDEDGPPPARPGFLGAGPPDPPFGNRVLVVDDERHIARLVQVNLESASYEVTTAFSSVEALKKLE